jgi:hypothetical protein
MTAPHRSCRIRACASDALCHLVIQPNSSCKQPAVLTILQQNRKQHHTKLVKQCIGAHAQCCNKLTG